MIIALLYILFLIIDISYYKRKVKQYQEEMESNQNSYQVTPTENGQFEISIPIPSFSAARKTLQHHYCLSKDQHAANFYLKIGAAGK